MDQILDPMLLVEADHSLSTCLGLFSPSHLAW